MIFVGCVIRRLRELVKGARPVATDYPRGSARVNRTILREGDSVHSSTGTKVIPQLGCRGGRVTHILIAPYSINSIFRVRRGAKKKRSTG